MSTKAKTKTDLFILSIEFERILNKSFDEHFEKVLKRLFKSAKRESLFQHIKEHKEKIRETLFTTNLQSKILLILLKNNCVCVKKNVKICLYCGNKNIYCCTKKKKPEQVITPSNWDETKLVHGFRAIKNKIEKKGITKSVIVKPNKSDEKNSSNFTIDGGKEQTIYHRSIFELPIKLTENSLFDKSALNLLSGTNRGKNKISSLMADVLKKRTKTIQNLIKESVRSEMRFYSRIASLYQIIKASNEFYSGTFYKKMFPKNEELEFIDEGLKFIETMTGAGLYYLRNTEFIGCISIKAVRNYMRSTNYNFTEDHIYRRKLAAKYLLTKTSPKIGDLYVDYTEKYSSISLLDGQENKQISKDYVSQNRISKNLDEYLPYYLKRMKSEYDIEMIKTTIKSKDVIKKYIKYLMKCRAINKNATNEIIKDKLKLFNQISFWVN